MVGSWKTFSVVDTSTETFSVDLSLTDGSVLVHNRGRPALTVLGVPARTAWRPAGTASRNGGVKPAWRRSPQG